MSLERPPFLHGAGDLDATGSARPYDLIPEGRRASRRLTHPTAQQCGSRGSSRSQPVAQHVEAEHGGAIASPGQTARPGA